MDGISKSNYINFIHFLSEKRVTSSERLRKFDNLTGKELPSLECKEKQRDVLFDSFASLKSQPKESFNSDISLHLDEFFKSLENVKIKKTNEKKNNEIVSESKTLKISKIKKKKRRACKKKDSEIIDYQMEPFAPIMLRKFKSYLPIQGKKARLAEPHYLKKLRIEGEYTKTISKNFISSKLINYHSINP